MQQLQICRHHNLSIICNLMNYLQFEFENENAAQKDMLLALLADTGFEGFEEDNTSLKAFIKEENFNQKELDAVLALVPAAYSTTIVKEENWNAKWESEYEPVIVNDFVAVRASFHKLVGGVKHEIIITPKMSFGTGHHATTYLVMEQMSAIDFKDKKVIDFGTGTGVLAILAEKMGAASIMAIDNDDWSIENAQENIETNGCKNIRLQKVDTVFAAEKADVILANINLNVITANIAALATVANKGAIVLLSGFLVPDKEMMIENLKASSIECKGITLKGEWICLRCQTG